MPRPCFKTASLLAALFVAGTSPVSAESDSGIFEALRQSRGTFRAAPSPATYGALPTALPATSRPALEIRRRGARTGNGLATGATGEQVLCVRLCDGYAFPIATLRRTRDLSAFEEACHAGCPGTDTTLFSARGGTENLGQARSLAGGRPYSDLPHAFAFQRRRPENCSCQIAAHRDTRREPIPDRTLREGDLLAGTGEPWVVNRNGGLEKFTVSTTLKGFARVDADRLFGISDHAAREKAFRAKLRSMPPRSAEIVGGQPRIIAGVTPVFSTARPERMAGGPFAPEDRPAPARPTFEDLSAGGSRFVQPASALVGFASLN